MTFRLNGTFVPDDCIIAPERSTSNGCPSSEWESIQQFLGAHKFGIPEKYSEVYSESLGPDAITSSGKTSQRILTMLSDASHDPRIAPCISTTPMAAVADALSTISNLWFLSLANVTTKLGPGSPLSDQSDATHSLGGDSLQGFASVTCMPDSGFKRTDDLPLALPLLYYVNDPALSDSNITFENFTAPAIRHPDLTRGQIARDAFNRPQYSIRWIELSSKQFNGSSIGAAIFLP